MSASVRSQAAKVDAGFVTLTEAKMEGYKRRLEALERDKKRVQAGGGPAFPRFCAVFQRRSAASCISSCFGG